MEDVVRYSNLAAQDRIIESLSQGDEESKSADLKASLSSFLTNQQGESNQFSINERNQSFVVEVIRNIAEYAVYSERYNKTFMDSLIENNVFGNFLKIL
jgi:hypothetical protein